MTDTATVPNAPRFKSDWMQSILFGILVGIIYSCVVGFFVNDSVSSSNFAYGFLVMTFLGAFGWRFPEYAAAGLLGVLAGAPMSSQVAGTSGGGGSPIGMVIMLIPVAVPFMLFVMPRISKWVQQQQ